MRDPRRVVNQPAMPVDKAMQALLDTRRTLLKLVANIDAIVAELRKEERVTPKT